MLTFETRAKFKGTIKVNIKQTKADQSRKIHSEIEREGGHFWQSARLYI